MNGSNSGMIKLHETKRVRRGNPVKYPIYIPHSALCFSLYIALLFIVQTMDCRTALIQFREILLLKRYSRIQTSLYICVFAGSQ